MQTPFPGMDPYLERRGLWEEVHTDLITSIRQFLTPLLRPRYLVAIEQRIYLSLVSPKGELIGKPDVMVVAPKSPKPKATRQASVMNCPNPKRLSNVIWRFVTPRPKR